MVTFFAELLVHTKGPYQRTPFILDDWQEYGIIRPLFGETVWSVEWACYVRRYRIAYIILGRKNGKSELAAGILLYLLIGDDEESAEVYGAAKDTKQAGKVFEPALRMSQLSPRLVKRLRHVKNARRLIDERTASYYEVIDADAKGQLGHSPHGFNLDEVLSQPDGTLWEAMTSAVGTRLQELQFATSTETNDPGSFGAELIDEAERIQEDPARAPHVFTYVRKLPGNNQQLARVRRLFPGHPDLPVSCEPFDEANWRWANPALDGFKSRESMRRLALEAKADPRKENAFRQFHCNQRVSAVSRFVSVDLWTANAGEITPEPNWWRAKLAGQNCWAGLDLSSKLDLTAWALLFEDGSVLWRYWAPASTVRILDRPTGGDFTQWCQVGWVTLTEGSAIDYQRIYRDIEADVDEFVVLSGTYDRWTGEPIRQEIENRTGLELVESSTTYERMTEPMQELQRLLTEHDLRTGANPVSQWMAESLEARSPPENPEKLRPVKPNRLKSAKRIDGMVALLLAIDSRLNSDTSQDFADAV